MAEATVSGDRAWPKPLPAELWRGRSGSPGRYGVAEAAGADAPDDADGAAVAGAEAEGAAEIEGAAEADADGVSDCEADAEGTADGTSEGGAAGVAFGVKSPPAPRSMP